MVVYPAGEYCEIDSDIYEVLASDWSQDNAATWTMILRPCDGRTHNLVVHDIDPVMCRNQALPAKPPAPVPAPEFRALNSALKQAGVGAAWLE